MGTENTNLANETGTELGRKARPNPIKNNQTIIKLKVEILISLRGCSVLAISYNRINKHVLWEAGHREILIPYLEV